MKFTKQDFLNKSRKIHGNKYNYDKFDYIDNRTKSVIICPEHGEFKQTPTSHYNSKGCPECTKNDILIKKKEKFAKEFIGKANKVHNHKYDYSKVVYNNVRSKVTIICPEHGEFYQTPNIHLNGHGCSKCNIGISESERMDNKNSFIEKANKIHNHKYDYSKFEYKNIHSKSIIICPEHGEFIQSAAKHIYRETGCIECNKNTIMSKPEIKIFDFLKSHNIEFYYNHRFETMKMRPFDFYIPDMNLVIEYDGEQHFNTKFKMLDWDLEKRKKIDKEKTEFCLNNNYNLIRINYKENLIKRLNEIFCSTTNYISSEMEI